MNLNRLIHNSIDISHNKSSRIHRLSGYIPQNSAFPCYIKREDELNPSAIGGKHRKYISLLPAIRKARFASALLIGSANSNNLLGLTQLLLNEGLAVHLLVKKSGSAKLVGNQLFLNMLLPKTHIHMVSASEWTTLGETTKKIMIQLEDANQRVLLVPEGGELAETIPGLLTLALEIEQQQRSIDVRFSDIWIDSGTGISAIGLLLGMRLLGLTAPVVHVTLIAGNEAEFMQRYRRFETWTEQWLGHRIPSASPDTLFHTPTTARSFGSTNSTIMDETITIARETGILMDPVYSVKHLFTMKRHLMDHPASGPQLFIYNGGPLGLCGFQDQFAHQLSQFNEK